MKKVVSLVLVMCALLALAGCGGEKTPAIDLAAFYETIAGGEDFPAMIGIDEGSVANVYPGLEAVERAQTVLYMAAISATPCEIAMVEVANEKDAKAVRDIFQARIDAQVAGGAWYPETIEAWQRNAKIVTRGPYVCLFVVPDEIPSPVDAFEALK